MRMALLVCLLSSPAFAGECLELTETTKADAPGGKSVTVTVSNGCDYEVQALLVAGQKQTPIRIRANRRGAYTFHEPRMTGPGYYGVELRHEERATQERWNALRSR